MDFRYAQASVATPQYGARGVQVSERSLLDPIKTNCLFTPELQWKSRGQRRIYLTGARTGNACGSAQCRSSWPSRWLGSSWRWGWMGVAQVMGVAPRRCVYIKPSHPCIPVRIARCMVGTVQLNPCYDVPRRWRWRSGHGLWR